MCCLLFVGVCCSLSVRCLLIDVRCCCLVCAVRSSLSVACYLLRCMLLVVRCFMFVVFGVCCCFGVRCRWMFCVVCWLLIAVRHVHWLVGVERCSLLVVRCVLCVACVLFVGCCFARAGVGLLLVGVWRVLIGCCCLLYVV